MIKIVTRKKFGFKAVMDLDRISFWLATGFLVKYPTGYQL